MTELNQMPACSKPLLSPVRVFNGDCLEIMKSIPDVSIDMILCDLPYGTTACAWDVIIPFDKLWEQYERIIKPNGAIVLTASQPFTSALIMSNPKLFKVEWIWEKNAGSNFGSVKFQPMKEHENILVFGKSTVKYYPIPEKRSESGLARVLSSDMTYHANKNEDYLYGTFKKETFKSKAPELRVPRSIQKFKRERGLHPTQKPVPLFEYLIKTYTNEGETVLDNCAGSGTTAIACINTNRNCILIEKEQKYFDIINERIDKHKQQRAGEFSFENEM
jgi:site-specific DNA-methyltransferase (adenine-specific)